MEYGKKIFAKEFSKRIMCLENGKEESCKCSSCLKFEGENNPDFTYLEPDGKGIKIDQIRQMRKRNL